MYFDAKATGERISELRLKKKLTQEKMAEQLNITVNYLGKMETGIRTPSIDLFIEMAEYFDVSLDYIVCGKIHGSNYLKKKLRVLLTFLHLAWKKCEPGLSVR